MPLWGYYAWYIVGRYGNIYPDIGLKEGRSRPSRPYGRCGWCLGTRKLYVWGAWTEIFSAWTYWVRRRFVRPDILSSVWLFWDWWPSAWLACGSPACDSASRRRWASLAMLASFILSRSPFPNILESADFVWWWIGGRIVKCSFRWPEVCVLQQSYFREKELWGLRK